MSKILKDQTRIAAGKVMEFDGFLKLREDTDEDVILPTLKKGSKGTSKQLTAKQNATKPAARYTEATLVKMLENKGIGRPSTYASTISTIQDRGYVMKDEGKLKPTEIAFGVNDFLEEHFDKLMDYEFTALMEDQLDTIARGELNRQKMLSDFYLDFEKQIINAEQGEKIVLTTGKKCPKCGVGELVVKFGKSNSRFLGCTNYPECDYISETEDVASKLDPIKAQFEGQPCPAGGTIVVRMGRFWPFLSSSLYPEVKRIKSPAAYKIELEVGDNKPKCPNCDSEMVLRRSRRGSFRGCSKYPDCNGIVNIK
jgi:DNA topoisomerase-1